MWRTYNVIKFFRDPLFPSTKLGIIVAWKWGVFRHTGDTMAEIGYKKVWNELKGNYNNL